DLDHVVIRARDIDASLGFYCDVLGCAVLRRVERLGLVQMRAGASMIDLIDAADNPPGDARYPGGARNMDHFALRLESLDVDAIRAHLLGHGIEMGDVATRFGAKGNGPSVYITDPDGNVVELKGPATGA
ncbi:MAG: VOC family protein, partial [Alphaproteobacteria bacterium]